MTFTRSPAPCGTMGAWHRHYRAGEKPCDVCKQAKAEADRKRDYRKTRPKPSLMPKPSKEMDALLEADPPVIEWSTGSLVRRFISIQDPHTDKPIKRSVA